MRIILEPDDLRPLIEQVVVETLRQVERLGTNYGDRLAYTEPEAAALLGVARHVLRDCRLRGEIKSSKCGRRIVYRREDLIALLDRK